MKRVLVTGAAGFIGSHLCARLLEASAQGDIEVIGFDNLNDYYDVQLKLDRLAMVKSSSTASGNRFNLVQGDLADKAAIEALFSQDPTGFDIVVNLAAQAGVRHSIENPQAYIDSNIVGFFNILEACRNHLVQHLVYASSSSVYGLGNKVPYSTSDATDSPVSLYAATKKSDELMAHAYATLYGIPCTGLRFFTVYGPFGRPDMAYFKFTNRIVRGEPIQIYNMGDMKRDFTYIDDVIDAIVAVMGKAPGRTADGVPHKVYNIGNSSPEDLLGFVGTLEGILTEQGVAKGPVEHQLLPMQPGDVYQTYADTSELERDFGVKPHTPLAKGLRAFATWYAQYYGLEQNGR